jgi:hypothetical protein
VLDTCEGYNEEVGRDEMAIRQAKGLEEGWFTGCVVTTWRDCRRIAAQILSNFAARCTGRCTGMNEGLDVYGQGRWRDAWSAPAWGTSSSLPSYLPCRLRAGKSCLLLLSVSYLSYPPLGSISMQSHCSLTCAFLLVLLTQVRWEESKS